VLPFTNLAQDPAEEYFSDGMSDDLITELSKLAGLFVIARNSTFVFKGKAVDAKHVAETLGVRYVLAGSVRRRGDRVRINTQLIDGSTGVHLWAERYDGVLDDVFALQDRVTRRIVAALEIELTPREKRLTATDGTRSVAAYDLFLRGQALQARKTPEDAVQALTLFSKAVEIDPNYQRARAAMAQIYWDHHLNTEFNLLRGQPSANTMVDLNTITSWELLEQVGDAPLTQARALRARMLLVQRRFDEAMREAQAAVELGPSDPGAHDALIENLAFAGLVEEALRHVERFIDLDPSLPGEKLFLRGLAHYTAGRPEQSLASLARAQAHNPDQKRYLVLQAAALAELGRIDEARQIFAEYKAWLSTFATENWFRFQWPFRDREVSQRLITNLLKVGVTPALQPIDVSAGDRLNTEQLRSLLTNARIVGADHGPLGSEDEFEITRDSNAQILSQGYLTYFESGKARTVIRDDLLCDPWWDLGLYCVAVFRNPSGSLEQRNEYAFFTLSGPFTFSVTKQPR
jgi:TolB-like protein